MRRISAFVVLPLALAGCHGPRVDSDLLDGLEWYAAVSLSAEGERLGSTPLQAVAAGGAASFETQIGVDGRLHVLGYEDETIAALFDGEPVSSQHFADQPVQLAAGCDATLPSPDGWLLLDEQLDPIEPGGLPPSITADWLSQLCPPDALKDAPPLLAPISIDSACDTLSACEVTWRVDGCELEATFSECLSNDLPLTGHIDRAGNLCLESERCIARTPTEGAELDLICETPGGERCLSSVYRPSRPPFEVLTRTLIEAEPLIPDAARAARRVKRADRETGYLSDLAVLTSSIVVIASSESRGPTCTSDANQFFFLDPETLDVERSADAPDCTTVVTRDPIGPGMIIGTESQNGLRLLRLNEAQVVIGGIQVPLPGPPETQRQTRYFVDLTWTGVSDRMAVLVASDESDHLRRREALMFFGANMNPDTVEMIDLETDPGSPEGTHVTDLSIDASTGRLVIVDDQDNDVMWFDIDGQLLSQNHSYAAGRVSSNAALGVAGGRAVLARSGDLSVTAIVSENPGTPSVEVRFFEGRGQPTAVASLSSDFTELGIGLVLPSADWQAVLAVFEPETPRFVPGAALIGQGAPNEIEVGPDGAVYVLLPWSGQVARVVPRP